MIGAPSRLDFSFVVVYYEWIKREPKIRGIYECRCDERLQTKTKKFTRLPYTGLVTVLVTGTWPGTSNVRNNALEKGKKKPLDKRRMQWAASAV